MHLPRKMLRKVNATGKLRCKLAENRKSLLLQGRVMKRLRTIVLLSLVVISSNSAVEAAGRGFLGGNRILQAPKPSHELPPFAGPPSAYRGQPYQYYRDRNPQYYGGFHSRQLQNVGIPTGDIGIRGNGVFWTPW